MKNHKNLSDEEIQQIIDGSTSLYGKEELRLLNEDAELYESIMDNLELEPSLEIPENFTKTTVEIAYRKKKIKDIIWKTSLYMIVSIPLIMISLIVTYAIGTDVFWSVLGIMKGYISYLVFALVLFSVIQFLDEKLIKPRLKEFGH